MRYLIILSLAAFLSCSESSTKEKETSTDTTAAKQTTTADTSTSPPAVTELIVNPLDVDGNQAQVTFTQKGKTMFYYDYKTKSGKIRINNTEYVLNEMNHNSTTGGYKLAGGGVTISIPTVKFKENTGEDCGYGEADEIAVLLNNSTVKLAKIEVQDCPDYN